MNELPARPCFHAHIVSTQELSARSIFDACLALQCVDLGQSVNKEGHNHSVIPERLCQLFQDVGLSAPDEKSDLGSNTGVLNPNLQLVDLVESEKLFSILRPARHALELLNQKDSDAASTKRGEIDVQAIVGATWFLIEHFGIRSLSCATIRVSSMCIIDYPLLFQNLPIEIDDSNEMSESVHIDGLALLQALFAEDGMERHDIRPGNSPSMKLIKATTSKVGITIVVGEVSAPQRDLVNLDTDLSSTVSLLRLERPDLWSVDRNLVLLESNIDDMTAEHLAFAVELIMQRCTVADCWLTPIVMKKGRSAHTLHCLCHEDKCEGLLQFIFQHTTTLGVRVQSRSQGLLRVALKRTVIKVPIEVQGSNGTTAKHTVDCKIGFLGSNVIVSIKPEFDDCKAVAMTSKQSIEFVCEHVIRSARVMVSDDFIGKT